MTDHARVWRVGPRRLITLDRATLIGIVNTTPDSFSDGGEHLDPRAAARAAERMVADGAGMLDVGAESTRPGAERVSPEEQIRRAVPAIRAIRAAGLDVPISIDTTRAAVAEAALDAGADAVNDVSGLDEDPAMAGLVAQRGAGLVLMHRLRPPERDSYSDRYADDRPDYPGGVVSAVREALARALAQAVAAGVPEAGIVLDPGLGFGKTVGQNFELVRAIEQLGALGRPLLGAASRKSFLGRAGFGQDSEPAERVAPTIACSLAQFERGIRLFRVHDVREHAAAFRVWDAVRGHAGAP